MFSATSLTLKPIMVTLLYWTVIQTVSFILFQVKAFWFWWRSIDIRPIDFALLAHFAFLEHLANRNRWQTKEYICLYLPRHALTCPPSLLLCKIHGSWMQPNVPKQGCTHPIVCIIEKDTLTWDHIAMQNKMVPNAFPSHQFGNNMFHLEIGTRNKRVLNGPFGNNVFHSEIVLRTAFTENSF